MADRAFKGVKYMSRAATDSVLPPIKYANDVYDPVKFSSPNSFSSSPDSFDQYKASRHNGSLPLPGSARTLTKAFTPVNCGQGVASARARAGSRDPNKAINIVDDAAVARRHVEVAIHSCGWQGRSAIRKKSFLKPVSLDTRLVARCPGFAFHDPSAMPENCRQVEDGRGLRYRLWRVLEVGHRLEV